VTYPDRYLELALGASVIVVVLAVTATELQVRSRARKGRPRRAGAEQVTRRFALLAVVCVFAGTLVWRIRTADQLAENPLDAAGLVRIAFDLTGLAFSLLAWNRLGRQRVAPTPKGRISPPMVYGAYVFVVVIGMYTAVKPLLVGFRAFELAVMPLAVAVVARSCTFDECLTLIKRILYCLIGSVVVSVLVFPAQALVPAAGGIYGYRLEGVLPAISQNTIGTIGLLLVAIGAGKPRFQKIPLALGLALIVLAQYRTGYIALGAMLVVFIICRWRTLGIAGAALLAYPLYLVAPMPALWQLWLRGEGENNAASLNGRTEYWARAIDVAERSPIIGTGLTSGTRFEVFSSMGDGIVSTIHSTWVEAYLGTGLVGVSLIAVLVLQAVCSAWSIRMLTLTPLLMVVALGVRSVTGSTIELAGGTSIIFALVATASWLQALALRASESRACQDAGHLLDRIPAVSGDRRRAMRATETVNVPGAK
jgi:O-antigen ligase